ncbi:MAG TPA: MmcQ/YjbR family DNA-binding protein [Thermoanaerobaculia bacterium]|nr:MmcQ/YjbR family DNA-binding protein [Thermoanaerobaculia bacterium]
MTGKPTEELRESEERLREIALSYPETYEEFPWGHRAVKVRKKTFVFIAFSEEGLSLSTKLPLSGVAALALPFASPTEYGLGKSGWVTARFAPGDEVPLELLREWLDESYRAIAPKKLAARLPPAGS